MYLATFLIVLLLNNVRCVPFEIPGNIKLGPMSLKNTTDKKTVIQENTISERHSLDKAKGTFGFNGNCKNSLLLKTSLPIKSSELTL